VLDAVERSVQGGTWTKPEQVSRRDPAGPGDLLGRQ
jgi:hypothetical protein